MPVSDYYAIDNSSVIHDIGSCVVRFELITSMDGEIAQCRICGHESISPDWAGVVEASGQHARECHDFEVAGIAPSAGTHRAFVATCAPCDWSIETVQDHDAWHQARHHNERHHPDAGELIVMEAGPYDAPRYLEVDGGQPLVIHMEDVLFTAEFVGEGFLVCNCCLCDAEETASSSYAARRWAERHRRNAHGDEGPDRGFSGERLSEDRPSPTAARVCNAPTRSGALCTHLVVGSKCAAGHDRLS